jgi:MutS domain V
MKAYLMYRDRDFNPRQAPPPEHEALVQDLDLETLFSAMSGGDKFLDEVVRKAVLASTADLGTIGYRQAILKDGLRREAAIRQMYDLAVETLEMERKNYLGGFGFHYAGGILSRSVQVMGMLVGMLRRLRAIAEEQVTTVESEGLRTMFAMLIRELDDEYFATIQHHLRQLRFQHGVLISAELGEGNKGINYVLRKPNPREGSWLDRLFMPGPPSYSYRLPERDEAGARALSELRDRGINLVANALAQSTDHILDFFRMLRTELAFYVACLNLRARLQERNKPICFPEPAPANERRHRATGLYDVGLALRTTREVVGNDLAADDVELTIITGANQGGKSTFLRSIGQAQMMMQCGMFVTAETLSANVAEQIFTHFKREEDAGMESGKFDEELRRMDGIVSLLPPDALMLFNESFAATNEREGSEVARQITTALIECRVKVFFVTHQYEFAHGFEEEETANLLFLRAERTESGERTFKVQPGRPLRTSYGEDLYRQIFGAEPVEAD